MNNISKVIRALVLIFMFMLIFHPVLTIVFLVKFGGIIGTFVIFGKIVKIGFGMSLVDMFNKAEDKDD